MQQELHGAIVGRQEHSVGFSGKRLLCFSEEVFQIYSDDPSQYLL